MDPQHDNLDAESATGPVASLPTANESPGPPPPLPTRRAGRTSPLLEMPPQAEADVDASIIETDRVG
ncbi:MAG TPA: hypothetical protein VF826_11525, partial [Chloroflexia bacterium]